MGRHLMQGARSALPHTRTLPALSRHDISECHVVPMHKDLDYGSSPQIDAYPLPIND